MLSVTVSDILGWVSSSVIAYQVVSQWVHSARHCSQIWVRNIPPFLRSNISHEISSFSSSTSSFKQWICCAKVSFLFVGWFLRLFSVHRMLIISITKTWINKLSSLGNCFAVMPYCVLIFCVFLRHCCLQLLLTGLAGWPITCSATAAVCCMCWGGWWYSRALSESCWWPHCTCLKFEWAHTTSWSYPEWVSTVISHITVWILWWLSYLNFIVVFKFCTKKFDVLSVMWILLKIFFRWLIYFNSLYSQPG